MSKIKAVARLVNGGILDFVVESDDLQRSQQSGLEGKALIIELITDDWGTPPIYVDFEGIASDGSAVSLRVGYS